MNSKNKIPVCLRYLLLVLISLNISYLSGQQTGRVPVITIISPAVSDSINTSGRIIVTAEILSYSPLQTFRINLNGAVFASETSIKPVEKGNNIYRIESFVTVRKGKNTVFVEAKNSAGSAASEKRTINSQLIPFITWLTPLNTVATVHSEKADISIEIRSGSPILNVRMNLNGTVSEIPKSHLKTSGNDIYILETPINLKAGRNNIYFTVNNVRGETRSVTRNVTFSASPAVTVINPAEGDSVNNSGTVIVRAEIVSPRPLQTFRIMQNDAVFADENTIKPQQADSNRYIIESLVLLKKGFNTLYVEVRNSAGSTVSEKRIVNYHYEPFIRWITPGSPVSTVESGKLKIKAEIKTIFPLQKVSININGNPSGDEKSFVTNLNDGSFIFEKTIILNPGINTIFLSAGNTKGESKTPARSVTFGSSPIVTLLSPTPADSLNTSGTVLVRAQIISSIDIQSFKIIHNGATVINEAGTKPIRKDSSIYIIESLIAVDAGVNTISVEAKNAMGTEISEKRTVTTQNKPFISWIRPEAESTVSESATLNVSAQIKTSFEIRNVSLNLNGTIINGEQSDLTKVNNETYLFRKSLPNILSAKNTISISATNLRGTTTSEPRSISFSAGSRPAIKITAMDSVNNTGIVLFNAEIVSRTKLEAVRLVQNGEIVVTETTKNPEQKDSITYIVKGLLPLKAGTNIFYVEAKNTIGTSASEKSTVVCQPKPLIKWTSPATAASTAGSENVVIKAEIITTLDLLNAGINVNGTLIPVPKEKITRLDNIRYSVEGAVKLNEGENSILIVASNARGENNSNKRTITYTPGVISEIKWILPADVSSDTRRAELPLSASIITRSELRSIRLNINGAEVPAGDMAKTTTKKNAQEYIYNNIIPLKPGVNTLELTAITGQGSITTERRTVNYSAPVRPVLEWQNPVIASSEADQGSVDIRMKIKSPDELNNLAVYLNGKVLDNINLQNSIKKENGDYVLGSKVPLSPGENSLYVSAGNIAGLTTSETRNIKFTVSAKQDVSKVVPEPVQITPPVITWVKPSNASTPINLKAGEIMATIKSAEKLQSLMVYVNGIGSEDINQVTPAGTPGQYIIKKTINLQPGDNMIFLSVTNSAGTIRSEDRILINPPASKPVITWAVPSDPNTVVNTDMIIVEACINTTSDLKMVQIFVNSVQWSSETVFQTLQSGDCSYRMTESVLLKEGENTVIINATNSAGSEVSERRTISFQKGIAEKRLALVIGNSEYKNTLALKNPVNDANLIEGTLKTLGFEVIKSLNANKSEMENAVRQFSEKLPNYNVALFYYAGHGIQVGGENYLIPTDATLNKEADCQWEAVTVNTIVKQFERVPENINILILDACRDNPFKSWSRGAPQGFKMLNTVSGTFVAFATSEGTTAADGEGINGTFTEELVKQMVKPQSIFNVFVNTRKQVMLRTNNRQRPQDSNMLTGDFYFKR